MTPRERMLKTIRFECPDYMPGWFWWDSEWPKCHSEHEAMSLMQELPIELMSQAIPMPDQYRATEVDDCAEDAWGCIWQSKITGILGQVVGNPIDSYDRLSTYRPPMHLLDVPSNTLESIDASIASMPDHLHRIGWMQLYERMRYLRRAEELYVDMLVDETNVLRLRDVVMEYLHRELDLYLNLDVDIITFSEDWGTQTALQISPSTWRRIFRPAYDELFGRIHTAGKMVEFHSCGYIRDIIGDLVDLGVEIVHSQVGCMDLEELSRLFRGKICFEADSDRQGIPVEQPEWIASQVRRISNTLGSPEGGLFIVTEVSGRTPSENVRAFVDAIKAIQA